MDQTTSQEALILAGMSAACDRTLLARIRKLTEKARAMGRQIVFVQSGNPHTALEPRFPDWVIVTEDTDMFDASHLAAQLRASGIRLLSFAGPAADLARRQARRFDFSLESEPA